MKLIQIFKNINKGTPSYAIKNKLGRWNRENGKKTELKIYYANEDHCGVCLVKKKDESNEYYMPFLL